MSWNFSSDAYDAMLARNGCSYYNEPPEPYYWWTLDDIRSGERNVECHGTIEKWRECKNFQWYTNVSDPHPLD